MTIEEFAKMAGCVIKRSEHPKGFDWTTKDAQNISVGTYKTELAAYRGWFKGSFDYCESKAILKLLKKAAKNAK